MYRNDLKSDLSQVEISDSEAEGGDTDELRGVLPPSESDKRPEGRKNIRVSKKKSSGGLKGFGFWKRLGWYWKYRQKKRKDSDFWRNSDLEENMQGRLPDGESLEVPAIWVAELYTPSTVGGLLKGIQDLGWEFGWSTDNSLTKWMNNVREGRKAGWISLGLVSSSEDAHFMSERTAFLPPKVRAAFPILMSLTPSLTAFIVAFLFDDETAASLKTPLLASFKTRTCNNSFSRPWHILRYVLVGGGARIGQSIYSPDLIRREQVKSQLQNLERDCMQWVRDRLPGAFASMPDSRTPTAVLLVTEQVKPLTVEAHKIRAFDALAINREYDAWESEKLPGVRLVLPRDWSDEGGRLVFGCRRRDAFPGESGHHNPTSNWTIVQRSDDYIPGLLSRWAISCLLDGYYETLSALRDSTAQNERYRPVRDLKELRLLVRTTLYDISACSQEIEEFTKSNTKYGRNVIKMTYARLIAGKKLDFLSELKSSQNWRAQQVQRDAALLKSTLATINDLSQIISNVRIQRILVFLTLISIGVASWAVFLTFRTVQ